MYINVESLCCTPETSIRLHVNDTSIKKEKQSLLSQFLVELHRCMRSYRAMEIKRTMEEIQVESGYCLRLHNLGRGSKASGRLKIAC